MCAVLIGVRTTLRPLTSRSGQQQQPKQRTHARGRGFEAAAKLFVPHTPLPCEKVTDVLQVTATRVQGGVHKEEAQTFSVETQMKSRVRPWFC